MLIFVCDSTYGSDEVPKHPRKHLRDHFEEKFMESRARQLSELCSRSYLAPLEII